jgi:TrmH family RNA methyltransferase
MNPSLCVVLVGPENAANVGFAARTMACYGLSDLRIVGSPGIAADGAARKTGKAVPETLDGAKYFASLADAIADCTLACGFTRRAREPSQRIEDLDASARAWRERAGSGIAALVFGRESQGLFREETLLLTHLVRIPLPSETLSLNVSHALAIGLYAFTAPPTASGAEAAVSAPPAMEAFTTRPRPEPFPTQGESAKVIDDLLSNLDSKGFFKGGKQEAQREYARLLWQRLQPNRRELDFLAGLLRGLGPLR